MSFKNYKILSVNLSDDRSKTKNTLSNSNKKVENTAIINLFGIIPIKKASVNEVDEISVVPSGKPFGIKMFTDGVMVVSISGISTDSGIQSPAVQSGIKKGDIILAINNQSVSSNTEVSDLIKNCNGNSLSFTIRRESKNITLEFTPVKSSDGEYKGGLWVRDSSAGIGTMTFFEPQTMIFAGLGHGVCDVDTGQIIPLLSGEIMDAEITGVNPSKEGTPGELNGHFVGNTPIGNIIKNTDKGIFGKLYNVDSNNTIPIAMCQQIEKGKAKILCCIDSNVDEYECTIEKIFLNSDSNIQNMVVKITDKRLLTSTGGIVQGMSGSPIIQNGMLVGALTHVFVDDPTSGYGIFAENMLETAQTVANSEKLRDAS